MNIAAKISERIMPNDKISLFALLHSLSQYEFASSYVKCRVILDVACGSGYGSSYLKDKKARLVIGGDRSRKAITAAKILLKMKALSLLF